MIEGTNPLYARVADGFTSADSRQDGDELRQFAWSELVARIRAAQDLRAIWSSDSHFRTASFSGFAAGNDWSGPNGEPTVNQDALGHCKQHEGIDGAAAANAARGDRES